MAQEDRSRCRILVSVRPIPITELGGRRMLARQSARDDCDPLLLFQAAGTRRPASICRPLSDPNIRSRSGMTEGPICGCSISPIQARLGTVLVGFDPSALLSPITQFARANPAPSLARGAMLLRQSIGHALSMSVQSHLAADRDIAHATFRRRDIRSSKHLRSRLSPSAIRAVSIAPYPSMMPARGSPSSGKE